MLCLIPELEELMNEDQLKMNIHKDQLNWFLTLHLSEREVFQLLTRSNLFTDPDRLHSSSSQELLSMLTTAFYTHSVIDDKVTQHLSEKSETAIKAIKRIGYMVVDEIHTYFKSPKALIETGDFGDVVWALLSDDREEVRTHGYKLLTAAYETDHQTYIQETNKVTESEESVDSDCELTVQENDFETTHKTRENSTDEDEKDESENHESRIDNLQLHKTRLEKKNKMLEQRCKSLVDENENYKRKIVDFQEKEEQISVLKNENISLQDETTRLRHVNEQLEVLEDKQEELLSENSKMTAQLNILSQLKDANESFQVELKLAEEAIYKEKSALDQLKNDLQLHFELIDKRYDTSRKTLNQIRQTVSQFDGSPSEINLNDRNDSSQPRVGVFVDVQNMFYAAKDRFERRVDYIKLLDLIVGPRHLMSAFAYIVQIPEIKQSNFISLLEHNGYTIRSKDLRLRGDGSAKGDWDVGIAVDVVSMLGSLDVVILASGDGDFCPLAELIKQQQKRIEVVAFEHNTSMDLQAMADQFFPIGEELLM